MEDESVGARLRKWPSGGVRLPSVSRQLRLPRQLIPFHSTVVFVFSQQKNARVAADHGACTGVAGRLGRSQQHKWCSPASNLVPDLNPVWCMSGIDWPRAVIMMTHIAAQNVTHVRLGICCAVAQSPIAPFAIGVPLSSTRIGEFKHVRAQKSPVRDANACVAQAEEDATRADVLGVSVVDAGDGGIAVQSVSVLRGRKGTLILPGAGEMVGGREHEAQSDEQEPEKQVERHEAEHSWIDAMREERREKSMPKEDGEPTCVIREFD